MDFDVDVVIVGGGPTGLVLAGDLARAGVSCAVLERRPGRSGLSRAFAVHARTLEELDARGVADQLVASGAQVHEIRFLADARLDLSRLPSRYPYALITPQYETERILQERAALMGADIRHGVQVTGLSQSPDGVRVLARDDGHKDMLVRAAYVVGADGMHSTVRQALGTPFPGKPVVRSVMLADVQMTKPPAEALTVSTSGDAFALVARFGDGWYRVVAWDRHNQAPESSPVSLAEVRDVTSKALGADFGMHDPRWLSRFHSDERQVPSYRDGRVLLAGDAAHVHSPAGGLGMNTGIQDGANLGWKLAATVRGWAPDGLLDSYQAERHPIGRQVLRFSGALLRIGLTGPTFVVAARDVLANAATRISFSNRFLAKALSGLNISYPADRGAHPLTGRRVADQPLADSRRLYEALRGGRFLLAWGAGAAPPGVVDGFDDRVESVTIARPSATVALIRPDAYVAWALARPRADNGTQEIRDALARHCGAPLRAEAAGARPAGRRDVTGTGT